MNNAKEIHIIKDETRTKPFIIGSFISNMKEYLTIVLEQNPVDKSELNMHPARGPRYSGKRGNIYRRKSLTKERREYLLLLSNNALK